MTTTNILVACRRLAGLALIATAPAVAFEPDLRLEAQGGVTLHRDLQLSGIGETFYWDVPDLRGSRIGDDQATSVSVAPGCRVRLFQHPQYQGAFTESGVDIPDLRGSRVGDDSVTSLQVRCGEGSGRAGAILYRDLHFTGASEAFSRDVPDLRGSGIGDDQATSVRVARGCRVRLYQHPDYRGAFTESGVDLADLRGSRVGDDSVTSLQVLCESGGWGVPGGSERAPVILYRDPRFGGVSESFGSHSRDLRASRIGNDEATSVRVSPGCHVHLYQHVDFQGGVTVTDQDISDLRGTRVGDDSISSLEIWCQ